MGHWMPCDSRGDCSLEKQVVSPSCLTLGLSTAAFASAGRQTLKGGMALDALMEKAFFFILLFCAQREKKSMQLSRFLRNNAYWLLNLMLRCSPRGLWWSPGVLQKAARCCQELWLDLCSVIDDSLSVFPQFSWSQFLLFCCFFLDDVFTWSEREWLN